MPVKSVNRPPTPEPVAPREPTLQEEIQIKASSRLCAWRGSEGLTELNMVRCCSSLRAGHSTGASHTLESASTAAGSLRPSADLLQAQEGAEREAGGVWVA